MAACVTCVFAVTLSVFPVITVRVQTVYQDNAAWSETSHSLLCSCSFWSVMDIHIHIRVVVKSATLLRLTWLHSLEEFQVSPALCLLQKKCSLAFAASSSSTSWTWLAAAPRLSSNGWVCCLLWRFILPLQFCFVRLIIADVCAAFQGERPVSCRRVVSSRFHPSAHDV